MNNETLVNNIRNLCKAHKIAISKLESELEFGSGLISRWVKTDPSISKVVDVADYFHITLDELIGRDPSNQNNIDKEFVNLIIEKTKKMQLAWCDITDDSKECVPDLIKNEINPPDVESFIISNYYELYVSKLSNGYAYIFTQYDLEEGVYTNQDLAFYIQADNESSCVIQDFDENQLYALWLIIHTQKYGELDEAKANEVKLNFINRNKDKNINKTQGEQPTIEEVSAANKLLNSPEYKNLMELMNSPQMQQINKILNNDEYKKAIEIANTVYKLNNKR